jgi:hypothetical protein
MEDFESSQGDYRGVSDYACLSPGPFNTTAYSLIRNEYVRAIQTAVSAFGLNEWLTRFATN